VNPINLSIDFPKISFGKKAVRRSFQASWLDRWPWLHYVESNEVALCFNCTQAKQQREKNGLGQVVLNMLSSPEAYQTGRRLL